MAPGHFLFDFGWMGTSASAARFVIIVRGLIRAGSKDSTNCEETKR
jgi:hypothetical protein